MLEIVVGFFANVVACDVNLEATGCILQGGKAGLAHHTLEHHAACNFGCGWSNAFAF